MGVYCKECGHEIDGEAIVFDGLIYHRECLKAVKNKVNGRTHKCPKCNGEGHILVEYDAYPTGLPDSGWATDMKTKKVVCDLCGGNGYTVKEYKPKMVQQGWE